MRFKTKRDSSLLLIFLFISSLFGGITVFEFFYKENHNIIGFSIFSLSFIILFYFIIVKTTYFTLTDIELICHQFFFKKTIQISSIRKVEKQNGLFAGLKMSTSRKALIVHYNKYDELLISPTDEDRFIEELEKRIRKNAS